jgi:hypothetical protein
MKKVLAFLAAAMLLLAACGREGPEDSSALTTSDPSAPTASADAVASEAPGAATAKASAPAGSTATTAPGTSAATAAPATSDRTAPAEGRANPPADGTYVYNYSGEASDPFNPAGPPTKFSGELTNEISHSGSTYTAEITNSEQPGRTTIKTRWSAAKVEMLSLQTESAAGDFGCTFNPPLLITKFPIKPETFPTQQLKGEGNACNGSLDITVVRKTTAADATKKSWSVWEVKVKTQIKSGQLTITQNETRYVSPELGVEVKSVGTSDGQYAAQKFKTSSTSTLKRHP